MFNCMNGCIFEKGRRVGTNKTKVVGNNVTVGERKTVVGLIEDGTRVM